MKAIEVENLTKYYGKVKAVDNISFEIEKGKICGILGPNGSGKTTTIKSICNLIIPDKGNIKIFGKDNKKSAEHISAVFEGTRNLYWRLTPKENLRYFAGIRGLGGRKIENNIDILLDKFNLTDKKDVMVNNLSRGMQQKVAIATTLICDTEIILLDEPTLGLDVQSYMDIKDILTDIALNMNKTILLSTHNMDLVQAICEEVVILNKGKIISHDTLENLMDMFDSRTYEVVLAESLSKEAKENLLSLGYDFYFANKDLKIEMDISDLRELYEIIDKLKEKNILIKEIKQKDNNFERIYLNITNGEAN
ncbi:ABC transporter ATP-binding protein [Anaerosalibacter bizertensis]|uniref:ABC transporter ATP-binding protein n=1 Tax=Anaerosalibacter bizertensis TaxID=932217 RepID=A0A844FG89_9FIRM|nr:ABC transporter ATP-binding protein [Anaerosalibacter bizertensis]MSS43063.1 ABC transporter ATP-binding protein [Anaerosalibacter bizertensis]HHV27861.1 ABC transporter ATP-binding protein [Tissierellia bacterium]